MFLRVSSQWVLSGMGGATGLDYLSVWAVIDRYMEGEDTAKKIAVFEDLQAMEAAALSVINAKKPS